MNCNKPAFNGKFDKTRHGNTYYKTDNAMKVGATYAGIGTALSVLGLPAKIQRYGTATGLAGFVLGTGISFAIHAGIGSYIDSKRNKHASEAADYINAAGDKKAEMTMDNIAISRKGHAYYESNDGAKYGTRIGAIIGGVTGTAIATSTTLLSKSFLKNLPIEMQTKMKNFTKASVAGAIIGGLVITGVTTLGGWILGKISDHYTNKNAERNA